MRKVLKVRKKPGHAGTVTKLPRGVEGSGYARTSPPQGGSPGSPTAVARASKRRCGARRRLAIGTGTLSLALFAFFFLAPGLYAQSGGYEVEVGLMGAVINKADNLWGNGTRRIKSLDATPRSRSLFLPMPLLNVQFTPDGSSAKDAATVLYFGGGSGPGAISLGLKQRFGESFIDVCGFDSLIAKNWQNPYALYRTSTSTMLAGGKITYGNILDTNLSVSYTMTHTGIDKDAIGAINGDLRQNGMTHGFDIAYRLAVGEKVSLIPAVSYEKGAFNGASNSYDRYKGVLALNIRMPTYQLTGVVSADNARFDRSHPIFSKTRDEDTYTAAIMATIPHPFGWQRFNLNAGLSRSWTNANITFFEKSATLGYAGLAYRF